MARHGVAAATVPAAGGGVLKTTTDVRTSTRIAGGLLITLLLVGLFELGSYLLVGVALKKYMGVLFLAPTPADVVERYPRYLAVRDPHLGWPSLSAGGSDGRDSSGARISPAFPAPGGACVSVYGDSFAWGDEVEHADAWTNHLAELLGCRVANFGVAGYGTDQAYLRFARNTGDTAPRVILTIHPSNVMRNVNQYRRFLTGYGGHLGFKPRFVLDADGRPRLVPLPALDPGAFIDVLSRPGRYLAHEFFLPGGGWGPMDLGFPYTWALMRVLGSARFGAAVSSFVAGEPHWARFLRPGHASRAFEVTSAIAGAFADLARERGKTLLVVMMPTPKSHALWRETGRSVYADLIAALRDQGIDTVDYGAVLGGLAAGADMCALLVRPGPCKGHFNARGNRVLARAVAGLLAERGLRAGP